MDGKTERMGGKKTGKIAFPGKVRMVAMATAAESHVMRRSERESLSGRMGPDG